MKNLQQVNAKAEERSRDKIQFSREFNQLRKNFRSKERDAYFAGSNREYPARTLA